MMINAQRFYFSLFFLSIAASLWAQQKPEVTTEPDADGRFTIGFDEKTLLFGYPHQFSSSHFIIKVGSRQASNTDGLYKIQHLKGERTTKAKIIGLETEKGSRHSSTLFMFSRLAIKQRLIPVNGNLQPVELGEYGQYYMIEYEITNTADYPQSVGFDLMLDAMVGEKDNCLATADGQLVMLDEIFGSLSVPEEVTFHQDHADPTSMKARLVTEVPGAEKPAALCVGQWAHLTNVFSLLSTESVSQYTDDSAIMLEWNLADLPPKQTRKYAVYFGSPSPEPINLQYHSPKKVEKLEIFFPAGDSNLTPEAESKIADFIKSKYIRAVLLEGYTDATGNEVLNQQLAIDRIESASFKLQMLGVKYERILAKSHGEFFANEDKANEQLARKVVITVWR